MTTRTLKIVVNQEGNASARLGGVSGMLGGIKGAAGIAGGALTLLGGAAVGAGSYLVGLGSDAEEMQGKFNVVFGDMAGDITKQLDDFGNAVGRNTYELQGMASTFGDTLKPLGFTDQALNDTTITLTKLATDLSSFNNMPMDEALARLRGTLVGSHENALAFGVVINENTLKQELARMGADELTGAQLEQAKVQARLNLLMAGTTDAQGDAARTSGSWANQTRALKAELTEAATSMGSELLPVVTPLLRDFTSMAREILPKAVEIFKAFAGDLKDTVGPAIMVANDAITRIAQAFGANTDEVSAGDVALAAFKAVLDAFVIAVKLGAVALQGLAWYVEHMRIMWDKVSGPVKAGAEGWAKAFSAAKDAIRWVKDEFDKMSEAAHRAADSIPDWLRPGSPTPFEMGLRGIRSAARDVQGQLPNAFAGVGGRGGAAGAIGNAAGQIIVNLTYAPAVSFANQYEAEQVLAPFIARGIRDFNAGLT